ncbi:SDR family NAD(P)-dependent oxidoreductase [Robiginitalea sp. SC105]|uniref:SDR family NAD(P)-dependent oxidoreductase n=1 Tax=Robiginitalea sp. SC105 TaxID=2762332 RepID=UPI0016396857|nr:SDR family oxidoreductase [Robiginitalea sp. SC105]MBC2840383.1 SDR family oxidoreductase [Robiginitalea sp. SC105]
MKKNILIIGGSSGIGLELVRLLKDTHNLYTASRQPGPLEDLGVSHIELDVTGDFEKLDGLPESLDGLVYCPGSINLKPFKMLSVNAFEEDLNLNFTGLVRVLKVVMPRFTETASLVFFSTVAVGSGMPFHSSVAASKGAIEGFARALAAEYAPQLRVNVIAPSLVDTPMASRLLNNEKKQEKMAERHPLKRVGKPGDIARMAAFLLSDDSSWMTGQVLGVDGGLSTLNLS